MTTWLPGSARGARVAEAVNAARDLVNEPGGSLTPPVLADRAVALGEANGVTVDVMDKAAIEAAGFGGLLGVNRGSLHEPRFIRMTHAPDGATGHVVLVGKGITFDAGGLSIKTADGMIGMNGDMGGGAAVIATMSAVAELAPGLKVTGLVPSTDNMLGPDATRPGDVLTISDGSTVEVLNTDAEGRLILADGLAEASKEAPDAIIDLATLTGACMVALGPRIAGLMATTTSLAVRLLDAGGRRGRAGLAPAPARGPEEGDRVDRRRHEERRQALGRRPHRRPLPAALRRRGHPLGPPRHRRPRLGSTTSTARTPSHGTGYGVRTLLELLTTWSD